MPQRLRINRPLLNEYMEAANIQSSFELSKRMGVSASTVYRVLDGTSAPGARFIAGIRAVFPHKNIDRLLIQ